MFVPSFGFGGSSQSQRAARLHPDAARPEPVLPRRAPRPGGGRSVRLTKELQLDTIWLRSTLGYAAARWLRVEGFYAFTRQDSRIDRRRSEPPAHRRPGRHLTAHEDPVMEERAFHPLDYLRCHAAQVVADRAGRASTRGRRALAMVWPREYISEAEIGIAAPTLSPELLRGISRSTRRSASAPFRSSSSAGGARARRARRELDRQAGRRRRAWLRPRWSVHVDRSRSAAWGRRERPDSFRLGYVDSEPDRAQRITNRLAYVFVEENSKTRRNRREHLGSARPAAEGQPGSADASCRAAAGQEAGEHRPPSGPDQRQHLDGERPAPALDSCSMQLRTEQDRLSRSRRSSRRCSRAPAPRR